MKTAFRVALTICLSAVLFASPSPVRADTPSQSNLQAIDNLPIEPLNETQPTVFVPLAAEPTTHYKTLTGLDFHPESSNLTYSFGNGGLYPVNNLSDYSYYAAYTLPQGATVTGITFFIIDNNQDVGVEYSAMRYDPETGSHVEIGFGYSNLSLPNIRAFNLSSGLPFTINNIYSYRLRVQFRDTGNTQVLCGARIAYTLPTMPSSGDQDVTIIGADFRPGSSTTTFTPDSPFSGSLVATAITAGDYFYTRLDLPQGAIIKEVKWFFIDNHTQNFALQLITHRPSPSMVTAEINTTTSGASATIQTIAISDNITIDNATNSYSILFRPQAAAVDLRIVGARVRYTPPATSQLGQVQTKTYSGIHFLPSSSALTYDNISMGVYALALSTGQNFQVSVDLPPNTCIQKITFYFMDDDEKNMTFVGRNYFPQTGTFSDPLYDISSGASPETRTLVFSDTCDEMGVIDPSSMITRLRVQLGIEGVLNHILVGAKVEYIYPQVYLPLIRKE